MKTQNNLAAFVNLWAEKHPHKTAFIFLTDQQMESEHLTYAQLNKRAQIIAAAILQHCKVGDRILLCYSPSLEFICAFLGCLYAGTIAVPAFPYHSNQHVRRLLTIIDDCNPALILGCGDDLHFMQEQTEFAGYRYLLTDQLEDTLALSFQNTLILPEQLALLQYTSGSTGQPKGVMVSHANIIANQEVIHRCCHFEKGYYISWLPMQHDMGLIGSVLYTLYTGNSGVLMAPATFLENPFCWLKAITDYKGYMSGCPNFGYQLCVDKITEKELTLLDLSHWERAYNGAEPISARTLKAFADKFAVCGFMPKAFLPCYGLAEATVSICGTPKERPAPVFTAVNETALLAGKFQLDRQSRYELVGLGKVDKSYILHIVDPITLQLTEPGKIGEIWVSGPSVAQGYWQKDDATEKTFRAHLEGDEHSYLRTGDLGYLNDEELYVTGRLKDLIILQGRNLYPQDIESYVEECHEAIRPSCTAAFSVDIDGQEQLVIVAEIKRTYRKIDFKPVFQAIRKAVIEDADAIPYSIQLLAPARALKTTSGKIQRQETKKQYLAGQLTVLASDDLLMPNLTMGFSLEQIEKDITTLLAKVLAREEIDKRKKFTELGGTSLHAILFQQQLEHYVGNRVTLSPSVAFDYPTIEQLALHLFQQLTPNETKEKINTPQTSTFLQEPIAIIGMACRFPGAADTPEAFWELLKAGHDGMRDIPMSRWNWEEYAEEIPVHQGAFVDELEYFDAAFFGIAPREAEMMDPQQRILLETTWHALEDAGIEPRSLKDTSTDVFIGATTHEYADLLIETHARSSYVATGNTASVLSGRIAYELGLHGTCVTLDTACSSALVAVHEACLNLQLGRSELAVVGAVNALFSPDSYINLWEAGMLSKDGRCKVFSENADGYARGEGCGVLILKRLSEAQKEKHRILAVIKGTVSNQDGASSGLTVPNGAAQEKLLRDGLSKANLQTDDIQYFETHGTGTKLGDPMEIYAISQVYKNRQDSKPLLIGSVKANIGHLEAAAGMASIIKVILSLQNAAVPPQINIDKLNSKIDLTTIPACIPTALTAWQKGTTPRRAAISAFGFSGTNAHVILEEAPVQDVTQVRQALPKTLFNRKRYWADAALAEKMTHKKSHLHPLLGERINLSFADASLYIANINKHYPNFIEDHRLFTVPVLSAPAYISSLISVMLYETGQMQGRLTELEFHQPLSFTNDEWKVLKTYVSKEDASVKKIQISSHLQGDDGNEDLHATGNLCTKITTNNFPILKKITELQSEMLQHMDGSSLYDTVAPSRGFSFKRHDKWINELWYNSQTSLARLRLPEAEELQKDGFLLHPGCIEACLHALLAINMTATTMYIPYRMANITYAITEQPAWAYISLEESTDSQELFYVNLYLLSAAENIIFYAEHMAVKSVTQEALARRLGQKRILKALPDTSFSPSSTLKQGPVTAELHNDIENQVKSYLSRILGVPSEDIDFGQGFVEQGMDSLMAVEFAQILQQQFGEDIIPNATVIYENPSVTKLINHIEEKLSGVVHKKPALTLAIAKTSEPLAIIGMGCRFPGGANSPEEFWQMLSEGRDGISIIPSTRWDNEEYYDPDPDKPGKINTQKAGLLDIDISQFDASFFNIAPREAQKMDPQLRLLLEVSCEALNDAGLALTEVREKRTGVFIGVWASDYSQLSIRYGTPEDVDAYTGGSLGVMAGRISYTLGLQGPSFIVDTACSSSLVALHEACISLRLGESQIALVGGVNLLLDPLVSVHFSKAHMLASDGYCKTFDKSADGYVRGEGCGMVVVKRLSDALSDNDRILAVIRETGINQDGASGGFTVPNGKAQEQLLEEVLIKANIPAHEVDCLEAHGTGTSLGDPIEVNAIKAVYGQGRQTAQPLILASVKTNIGHLESAAGMASLLKMILALQHKQIPAHLHFKECNPAINLESIPAVIPSVLMDWPQREYPKRAAISSFGATGTNAHLIIEEPPEQDLTHVKQPLPKTEFHRERYWASCLIREPIHYQLQLPSTGLLSDLSLTPYNPKPLGNHEILIKVKATGVNLRDILAIMQMHVGLQGSVGLESAGEVLACGAEVSRWSVGDEVFGIMFSSYADVVIAHENNVVNRPEGISAEEAAGLPMAYLTAYTGLITLAQVKAGDKVLIHAAASDVGLAAVQVAQYLGAKVYATAESEEEQAYLRSLDVTHIYHSCNLAFSEQILQDTDGQGVDVVLNSMTDVGIIDATIKCCAPMARYVEIGYLNILSSEDMAAKRSDIAYDIMQLDEVLAHPEVVQNILTWLNQRIASKKLSLLPVVLFPFKQLVNAFTYLERRQNIGKVVITSPPVILQERTLSKILSTEEVKSTIVPVEGQDLSYEQIVPLVREHIGNVLGMTLDADKDEVSFFELGMDSLMAVELSKTLIKQFPALSELNMSVIFDYSSISKLSQYMVSYLSSKTGEHTSSKSEVSDTKNLFDK